MTIDEPKKNCTASTEIYSRVTGYHRQIKNWNAGKQEEFANRKYFNNVATEIGQTKFHKVIFINGQPKIIQLTDNDIREDEPTDGSLET